MTFIARGAHLHALQTQGLRVDSVRGDFVLHPVQATDDPRQVGVVDIVLVTVKAWQVPEAAEAIRPLVGPATCVIPLQNGVEAPEQLAAALGTAPVVGGVCVLASFLAAPGHIRHVALEPCPEGWRTGYASQCSPRIAAPSMCARGGDGRDSA